MARNLVQIADDVKDMSVSQIQRELTYPSGNYPIWVLTGELDKKLKNLSAAKAQQAAAENASGPDTVLDGLMAAGNLPQESPNTTVDTSIPTPISNAGATATAGQPAPNPAIQALMTQNPNQAAMPTVRAARGYNAPVMYAGSTWDTKTTNRDTPRLTPEMWAMMTAARQKKGDPRLYGQGKASFEKAYREGAAPTSEPVFGGILSQLAAVERDRAYGGADTLPYAMKASYGGPVNNLPTVRMQGIDPADELIKQLTVDDVLREVEGGVTRERAFTEYDTEGVSLPEIVAHAGEGALVEKPRLSDLEPYLEPETLAGSDFIGSKEMWEGGEFGSDSGFDSVIESVDGMPIVSGEQGEARPEARIQPGARQRTAQEHRFPPPKTIEEVVTETQPPRLVLNTIGGDAKDAYANVLGLSDVLGEGGGREAVPSVAEIYKQQEELSPDLSKERKAIINKQEEALRTFEEQDVVPQSVKDIRDHLDGAVKALEKNPIPWMRAAAAAIDGRKPMLVAMTDAMIGYTEGKEELRKEGLEMMGKMADMDMQIATLETQQAKAIFEQKSLINQARLSEIEGRENRAAELIAAASAQQTAIADRNVDMDRIRVSMNIGFMQFMSSDAGQSRMMMNDLFAEKQNDPEYFTISDDGTATPTMKSWEAVIGAISPRSTDYSAQTAFYASQRHEREILNQINDVRTDAMKLADDNFDRELLAEDSAFKQWMAANKLSLPEGANVGDPSSKRLYQLWSITQDQRYISDPVIREEINKRFPELARIQSGSSGGIRKYNRDTGDFEY